MNKKATRLRRTKRSRMHMRRLGEVRLCIYRTPRHIYAQVIAPDAATVLASASTLEKEIAKNLKYTGNVEAATAVGTLIAERAVKAGVKKVAFDRAGFKYHGRIKALADAARAGGLEF